MLPFHRRLNLAPYSDRSPSVLSDAANQIVHEIELGLDQRQAIFALDDENRRREVGERASASAERFSVENAYDQICSLADKLVENIRDG